MKFSKAFAFLFIVASFTSIACAQDPGFQPAAKPATSRAAPAPAPSYAPSDESRSASLINSMDQLDATRPLGVGDTVIFRIVEDRAQPSVLRVQDSGDLLIPHIGLVKSSGRTCREVAFEIKKKLEASFYKVATVIIALDHQAPRGIGTASNPIPEFFTIFGQVQKQGKYELPGDEDVTVSQAILRAGGFAQFANTKEVKIVRRTPSGNKSAIVNLENIMTKGALDYDIYIRKDDVIIVKEKYINF